MTLSSSNEELPLLSKALTRNEPQFKEISIAYQVLSDPQLRRKYNEFGQKNGGGVAEPAGGFQDPEEVFGSMFGGERFVDLIGVISIGSSCPPMQASLGC